MNVLILGCGRVGSLLARRLDEGGNSVSILASREESLRNLERFSGYSFRGITHVGSSTDVDALRAAGIEGCDCIICASAHDARNIMCAQMAMTLFGKTNVMCRLADTKLASFYREKGIKTICPVDLTVAFMLSSLEE